MVFNILEFVTLLLWTITGSFGAPASSVGIVTFSASLEQIRFVIITVLAIFITVSLGDILAYELASLLSDEFRQKLRRFSFFRKNEEKAGKFLKRNEFLIIFFTRFILIWLCAVVSYVAGFEKVNRKKYISAVLAGEFLFSVIYVLIGFFVGEVLNGIIQEVEYITLAAAAGLVVVYTVIYFVKRQIKN